MSVGRRLDLDTSDSPDTTTARIRRALSFESLDTAILRQAHITCDYSGFSIHDTMDEQLVPDVAVTQLEVENLTTMLDQTCRELK